MACLRQLFPDSWFPDMETFLGHPGLQIWKLQIFFYGATWSKGYTEQSPDLPGTKGLYSQRNP
jgi:hypothetical protein